MQESAGGGQEVRAGRQSPVRLTPVYTGWEALLGATPGKACRRQEVLPGFWIWGALFPHPSPQFSKVVTREGLLEVTCDAKGGPVPFSLQLPHWCKSKDSSMKARPSPHQCPAWALAQRRRPISAGSVSGEGTAAERSRQTQMWELTCAPGLELAGGGESRGPGCC